MTLSRREFIKIGATAIAGGAAIAALEGCTPKDPADTIIWTPIQDLVSQVEARNNRIWRANGLVGGGCPCTIQAVVANGRALSTSELAKLELSKYYAGEVGRGRSDLWTIEKGYLDKTILVPEFGADKPSFCELYVDRVSGQDEGEGGHVYTLPLGKELVVATQVKGTTPAVVQSADRVVLWADDGVIKIFQRRELFEVFQDMSN
jgi:hypothetical protein